FLVLFPGAVWVGASADGLFMGVVAAGLALLAAGRGLPGGLLLGFALYLSYGLVLVGPVAAAVLWLRRRAGTVVTAGFGVAAVVARAAAPGVARGPGADRAGGQPPALHAVVRAGARSGAVANSATPSVKPTRARKPSSDRAFSGEATTCRTSPGRAPPTTTGAGPPIAPASVDASSPTVCGSPEHTFTAVNGSGGEVVSADRFT